MAETPWLIFMGVILTNWNDPPSTINGVTWGPYKWPKINGFAWGYNITTLKSWDDPASSLIRESLLLQKGALETFKSSRCAWPFKSFWENDPKITVWGCLGSQFPIWVFPKIGVLPNHPFS